MNAILANTLGKWIRDSESGSEASADGFDAENEQIYRREIREKRDIVLKSAEACEFLQKCWF